MDEHRTTEGGSSTAGLDQNVGSRALPLGLTAATGFGFLLVQLDVLIVNVALGVMSAGLEASVAGLQWIVDAYALTFAGCLLLAGSLGDRFGARRVFLAGFGLFLAASLGCGSAPDLALVIGSRVLQGFGAALMVPTSLGLLNHACEGDASLRARAVGWWTAAGSVGLALGPVLGGLLVGTFGWRAIFLINLPIGALGIWLTLRSVPNIAGSAGRFDWLGQGLGLVMIFALVGAAIEAGSQGWAAPVVLAGFLLAAGALAAFVTAEWRSPHPMLPLGFFRAPAFSAALLVGIAVNFPVYGTLFMVSLVLQHALGLSAIATGWVFLPSTVAVGISNVAAGHLASRLGPARLMSAGLAVAIAGFAVLWPLGPETSLVTVAAGLVLMGFGIGTTVPAMTAALLATVPRRNGGLASGVLNTVRQAAGAAGVAIFGALVAGEPFRGTRLAFTIAIAVSLFGIGAACAIRSARPASP